MDILACKPGHDGSIALLHDGALVFCVEAEKDSFPRYSDVTPSLVVEALQILDRIPDVISIGGWIKGFHSVEPALEAGYFGWSQSNIRTGTIKLAGIPVNSFSSTHERSHLLGVYGMSPFTQEEPAYALVWEGSLGNIYRFDPKAKVSECFAVMEDPGNKYSLLYALADPNYPPDGRGRFPREYAGKLMALAAYADEQPCSMEENGLIQQILTSNGADLKRAKHSYSDCCIYNVGVESTTFKRVARHLSDRLFECFLDRATEVCTEYGPLLIGGGCGLNCEWNTKWRDCGLFSDVFVSPCPNDSGSAIGTAVDAQLFYTGNAKIDWNIYAGQSFVHDCAPPASLFTRLVATPERVCVELTRGGVLAWVHGRYEVGPRALGNRSILAAPFENGMRDRLNSIKGRESFRPIAPVCLLEDVSDHFDWTGPSPHMLYFQRVKSPSLRAVTHVDGTARVQTVSYEENPHLVELLRAFKESTGYGLLCNTSLNFRGRGFINRMSDLIRFSREHVLTGFVVDDTLFLSREGSG